MRSGRSPRISTFLTLDACHVQQALAQFFGLPRQQAGRHARRFDGIEREGDVGVFVVDEGTHGALRQVARLVGQLLAGLIELVGDRAGGGVVPQEDRHQGQPRTGEGLDTVVPAQFLHALFKRFGNEILHLLRRGAGPDGGHRQHLDREGRIFGAAELEEGEAAGQDDRDDQEQGDRALPNREGGEVEAHHRSAT
jgi:hypothetical protein